jgi:hypothetical protein
MSGVFVDRLEGEVAVLVVGGRERRVPLQSLPAGVREGDWLSDDLTRIDPAQRERAEREIRERRKRLAQDDDGGDFSL